MAWPISWAWVLTFTTVPLKLCSMYADFPANRRAAQKAPLINFARRPIWLVRGEDLAGNDFVTGFATTVGQWAEARW